MTNNMAIMIDEKICGGNKELHNIPMNMAYNKAKTCTEILTFADDINIKSSCKTKSAGCKKSKK